MITSVAQRLLRKKEINMPPKIKIIGTDIIDNAINIVREHGIGAINARSLAAKLNCTARPLFREFDSMEKLKTAVIDRAAEIYTQTMKKAFESSDGFSAMGIAYIKFARMEPNLFRLLFMTNLLENRCAIDIAGSTIGDDEVIADISNRTGLDIIKSQELYTGIWLTTHGIASLLATNSCMLSDEEIINLLNNSFYGLVHVLQSK